MLMRFDPFRELDRLAQPSASGNHVRQPSMPMDAYRRGDRFLVKLDLPGVDAASIELTVERNVLTIRAERDWAADESVEWVVAERPRGTFSRQLFLGEGLDPDRIQADYDQGVLTVNIPVAEQAKARRVEVSSGGGGGQAISTGSTGAV
jgi:HSP20 family protein